MELKTKQDVEKHVIALKNFYGELTFYIATIALCSLFWLFKDGVGAEFWPKWIVFMWGISLFIKASKLHIIDFSIYKLLNEVRSKLPFLHKSWEAEKVNEIIVAHKIKGETPESKKAPAAKKTASAGKKTGAKKKSPVKKD